MTAADPAPVAAKPRRKRRWLRRTLWAVGLLAALWLVAFLHATWRLHRVVVDLKQRGEPTTFAEANARNHATEAFLKPTAVDLLREAVEENERIGCPGDASAAQPAVYSLPMVGNQDEADKAVLRQARKVIELVDRALTAPIAPWTPLGAELSAENWVFPLAQNSRSVARLLVVDLRYEGFAGSASRLPRLQRLYRLSETLAKEQFAIPQLIRLGILSVADDAARCVLDYLDEFELAELDQFLGRIDDHVVLAPALFNQRALDRTEFETPDVLAAELRSIAMLPIVPPPSRWEKMNHWGEERWIDLLATPLGLPLRRRAAAETLSIPPKVLKLVDHPLPWPDGERRQFDAWKWALNVNRELLSGSRISVLEHFAGAVRRAHRRLALLRLAARILRYRRLHDRLPRRLVEVSDFAPGDPATRWFCGDEVVYTIESRGGEELGFRLDAPPSVIPEELPANDAARTGMGLLLEVGWLPSNAIP